MTYGSWIAFKYGNERNLLGIGENKIMRVSYNWLKQYVDTDLDAVELSSRLTFAGLELDEIET